MHSPRPSSPRLRIWLLAMVLPLVLVSLGAAQSAPAWNRSVNDITVYLDAAGAPVIFVPLKLEVSNPGTIFDLSTTVSVTVNGTPVGDTITYGVVSDGPTLSCTFDCGSDCGPLYVDGVLNTMICHETDINDCSCGHWFAAEFDGDGLDAGDLIMVQIQAASGALPDDDTSDNLFRLEYPGEPMGWNRRLSGIAISESSAGPGLYDVTALIDMRASQTSAFLDLSTDVMLTINGSTVPLLVGLGIQTDGPTGDCALECGGGCGGMYVDGVLNTMTCHLDGPGDCDCGYWIKANFPGVELEPGDLVSMELLATAAAVPEADTSDDLGRVEFQGEEVDWGRTVHAVAVVPAQAGGSLFDVFVIVDADMEGLVAGTDMSTAMDLAMFDPGGVNMSLTYDWGDVFGFNDDDCEFNCGHGCGPMYLDGVFNTLTCHLDGPGDCDCGYWLQAPGGEGIDFGDEPEVLITAVAHATGGGAPDADPAGGAPFTAAFDGSPIGWNRAVTGVALTPGSAGTWNATVEVSVAMAEITRFMDMSFDMELQIDGVPVASQTQMLTYQPDLTVNTCEEDCSGGSCGEFGADPGGTIAAQCLVWPGFAGCSCGASLSLNFESITIPDGALLVVVIRPTLGALPELPGFDEDDELPVDTPTGVGDAVAGALVSLSQNRPNPFNPSTVIEFRTAVAGPVTLDVFDAQGTLVRRLVDEHRSAGVSSVTWDGRDGSGRSMASGHYFYRLVSPRGVETRKMSLIK